MAALHEKTNPQDSDTNAPEYVKPEHVTDDTDGTATPVSLESGPGFDAVATKKLLRKLDWHLVPFLALLYL